jgi:hypothetical protein
MAALLDNPLPIGIVLQSSASIPGTADVIGPRRRCGLDLFIHGKLERLARKRFRSHADFAVVAPAAGDQNLRLDRHGQDEPVVVVGVLADQVHPARRAEDVNAPPRAERALKIGLDRGAIAH